MNNYKKNKSLLEKTHNYKDEMEHDACGVGIIASTDGRKSKNGAWSYNSPTDNFIKIKGYIAIYPNSVDSCLLNKEEVKSQEGDFYGGWITSDIIGPFKGGVGSYGW